MEGRPLTISTHTAHKPPWTGGVAKLAGVGHRWVWVSSISYMYARASLALGGTGDESELDRTGPNWTELGPVQKWTEVGYFRSTSSTTPSPVARADERSGPPFSHFVPVSIHVYLLPGPRNWYHARILHLEAVVVVGHVGKLLSELEAVS